MSLTLCRPHKLDDVKFNNYARVAQILVNNEKLKGMREENMNFDISDAVMVTRDVCDWHCLVTQKKQNSMELVRWNPEQPASVYNMALLNCKEAKKHYELKTMQEVASYYPKEVVDRFDKNLEVIKAKVDNREPVLKG